MPSSTSPPFNLDFPHACPTPAVSRPSAAGSAPAFAATSASSAVAAAASSLSDWDVQDCRRNRASPETDVLE
ncbi:hypothetical protein CSUB01_00456 [Colletotrichum sublineola]|uniref:Uncharacterized protein n=1 Tax=Colletotrichum sublineola TaxID=1173701 RepID=A0A066XA00_COLSU|nr:hypothetical protein CSUB01_00456 [Colletotrichum sublineola]